MNLFAPARKSTAKARIGLAGPTGAGKTFTALRLAAGLAGSEGKVAVIDTEHGSASLYADMFAFDVAMMNPPYSPSKYRMAIGEASDAGYDVLVIDSITHAWNGTGGVLEIVDEEAKRQRGNKFAAWAVGSEEWKELLDTILGCPMHAIVTMRSKMEYVQQENSRGKTEVVKVGMAPEARDGIEYEFTVVGDLDQRHSMVVSKSRIAAFADRVIDKPGEQVGADIRAWLTEDEPDPVEQAFKPAGGQAQAPGPGPFEPVSDETLSDLLYELGQLSTAARKKQEARLLGDAGVQTLEELPQRDASQAQERLSKQRAEREAKEAAEEGAA